MRTVFSNAETAHVWAQQIQDYGRNSKESLWFEGPALYSYRTVIAYIHEGVCYYTTESYSVTTTSHVSDARSAASHMPQIGVPELDSWWDNRTDRARLERYWIQYEDVWRWILHTAARGRSDVTKKRIMRLINDHAGRGAWGSLVKAARRARSKRNREIREARRREFEAVRAKLESIITRAAADFDARAALSECAEIAESKLRPMAESYRREHSAKYLYNAAVERSRDVYPDVGKARNLRAKARRLIREGYAPARRYSDAFARRVNVAIRRLDSTARTRDRAYRVVQRYARLAARRAAMTWLNARPWSAYPAGRPWYRWPAYVSLASGFSSAVKRRVEAADLINREYTAVKQQQAEASVAADALAAMAAITPPDWPARPSRYTPAKTVTAEHYTGLKWPRAIPGWTDPGLIAAARRVWDAAENAARQERQRRAIAEMLRLAERRARDEIARMERLERHRAFAAAYPDWQAWAAGFARGESLAIERQHVARDLPGARKGVYAVRAVSDSEIVTSGGAHAPLAAAIVAWRKAEWCAANGREWRRNGETLRAGYYQIDKIDAHGNLRAGCHLIPLAAMRALAEHLGIRAAA